MKRVKQCSFCLAKNVCDLRIIPNSGRCIFFINAFEALTTAPNSQSDAIAALKNAVKTLESGTNLVKDGEFYKLAKKALQRAHV